LCSPKPLEALRAAPRRDFHTSEFSTGHLLTSLFSVTRVSGYWKWVLVQGESWPSKFDNCFETVRRWRTYIRNGVGQIGVGIQF
jgi:hypothetical protein